MNEKAKQVLHNRVVKFLREAGYIPASESIIAVAEAAHSGRRTEQGRMWVITDRQTIVWQPGEPYPVVAVGHGNGQAIAGGNFDDGWHARPYVAYVVDVATERNIAKDTFLEPSPEFTAFLDDQRLTGGPYRQGGQA